VIVRVVSEGMFEVDSSYLGQLDRLNEELEAAVEGNDTARYSTSLNSMIELVHSYGTPTEDFQPTDFIVPDSSTSLEQAATLLGVSIRQPSPESEGSEAENEG
jgi:hypothetical protein